jgi:hypothetical protein
VSGNGAIPFARAGEQAGRFELDRAKAIALRAGDQVVSHH